MLLGNRLSTRKQGRKRISLHKIVNTNKFPMNYMFFKKKHRKIKMFYTKRDQRRLFQCVKKQKQCRDDIKARKSLLIKRNVKGLRKQKPGRYLPLLIRIKWFYMLFISLTHTHTTQTRAHTDTCAHQKRGETNSPNNNKKLFTFTCHCGNQCETLFYSQISDYIINCTAKKTPRLL